MTIHWQKARIASCCHIVSLVHHILVTRSVFPMHKAVKCNQRLPYPILLMFGHTGHVVSDHLTF